MPLKFHEDAIVLSGKTGTKIKAEVIGNYYYFWQKIVSGGSKAKFRYPSCIIEMNAGTGEIFLEDEAKTILGSAGHALDIKYNREPKEITERYRVILIEESQSCRERLIKVISRRWPQIKLSYDSSKNIWYSPNGYVQIFDSPESLSVHFLTRPIPFGNCLFFFDPLRATDWNLIESIATERIKKPYQSNTEFLIFLFTSDWIRGRKGFSSLPRVINDKEWAEEEKKFAKEADKSFGGREWLSVTTQTGSDNELEEKLVNLYKNKLLKWFRFVLPLPFAPKTNERYDLYFCTNYTLGASLIRKFFHNMLEKYEVTHPSLRKSPAAKEIYPTFKTEYPEITSRIKNGRKRPVEWKILWEILRNHPDGRCDEECPNLIKCHPQKSEAGVARVLNWLEEEKYLEEIDFNVWPWSSRLPFPQYKINWLSVERKLGILPPPKLVPLSLKISS